MESLQLKPGEVIYKCPKCCCIKPERAHHCRYHGPSLRPALLPTTAGTMAPPWGQTEHPPSQVPRPPFLEQEDPSAASDQHYSSVYWTHGLGSCPLGAGNTENQTCLFQYLQKMYSENGSSLPVGEQLCRRKESEIFCALHYVHSSVFSPRSDSLWTSVHFLRPRAVDW